MFKHFFNLINVFGGLTLFLFGVEQCSVFFRKNLNSNMKNAMAQFTKKNLHTFLLGVGLSALTQSSTIATSFAIGFVDAGIMPFTKSLIVMMGASLGGTFVSFLLGLNIFIYAPLFFGVSFFLSRVKNRYVSLIFGMLRCLSLIFLGMLILGTGTKPIFSDPEFHNIAVLLSSNGCVMGVFAFLCAGLLQSSSAVIALGLALCASNALPAYSALFLALGAHIGSTAMVLLAGLNATFSARKLGVATFLFKLLGGAVCALCLPLFHSLFLHLGATASSELIYGQILIATFNIVLFIPFPSLLIWITEFFVHSSENLGEPKYLNERLLNDPELAGRLLSREMCRLMSFMEAYLQMLLEPKQRDEKLFSLLPKAILDLCEACQEFTYRLQLPLNDGKLRENIALTSYAMSNIRGMTKLLCGSIKYNLESEGLHKSMEKRLGPGLWLRWRKLSRVCLRDSFRAFVIGEQGLVESITKLENEIAVLSTRIRRELGMLDTGYDRDGARVVRLVSLMQGFLGMAKELAEGESFVANSYRDGSSRISLHNRHIGGEA